MSTKTRYVSAKIDEDIFDTLSIAATASGMRIDQMVAQLIVEGLETLAERQQNPDLELRVFMKMQQARRWERMFIHLQQIGSAACESQDPDELDEFAKLCEEAGFTTESVLQRLEQIQKPSSSLPTYDSGTGVRSAIHWLQETLDPGERLPSSEIKRLGSERGFTYPTLTEAKRHLGIASVKEDKQWWWVMPERET